MWTKKSRPDRSGRLLVVASTVLVLAGVATAAGTGWTWFRRVNEIRTNQVALTRQLRTAWTLTASDGAPTARLYLPRLRLSLVVVEGVDDRDLLRGPGHIPGTASFGEPGNTGVAGHRYPGVFWDLDRLRTGDPVVVETPDRWYVYRVDHAEIVGPDDTRVLAAPPTGQLLTLVTCDPVFTTAHRLIRQAVLVRSQPHDGPRPAEAPA